MKFKYLTLQHAVSGQIQPANVQTIAEAGFTTLINNRPDGEMWGQPKSAVIEAAAHAAGMSYHHLPVSLRGLDPAIISQLRIIHKEAKGKIFAFCNSGTRSANVWALAQAVELATDDIIAMGMKAGYNLHGLRAYLDQPLP